jgi:hypothetical protein
MRVLIITSCTGEKRVADRRQLARADFRKGPAHVARREKALSGLLGPAEELYTGQQHVRLMRGVRHFRESAARNGNQLDLLILSAGYGLVPGERTIAPYECTFEGMKSKELTAWAKKLGVPAAFRAAVREPYELALVLLGDSYLKACALSDDISFGGPTILFCGGQAAASLPKLPNARVVALTNKEAKQFGCALVGLKGELAARLLNRVGAEPELVRHLPDPAFDLATLFHAPTEGEPTPPLARYRPNASVNEVIAIPAQWWDKPHRDKVKYFIPDWDDQVDPDYDFATDTHSGGSSDWSNQVYAHQIFPEPNYDGILISKVIAEDSKRKKARINELGVHRFLRVPPEFPVMGDCGAFGYIQKENPPYTTAEILDYYTRLGFDAGVSIDHLIVAATVAQQKHRYDLTIQNAEDFLKEHRRRGLEWEPIGAVQGWDAESYAVAARRYVAMGYDHIALGGLVRSTTPDILRIAAQVRAVVPRTVKLHLFGVARLNGLRAFAKLGVTSVDSVSYLRQAWMRSTTSYVTEDDAFAALRIPEAGKSFRAKQMKKHKDLTEERVQQLEQEALRAVRCFAVGEATVNACLDSLLAYDRLVTADRVNMRPHYHKTLTARPWERCPCHVCRTWGVEVIIFRGNNRNRRRGFHNTAVFYKLFQHVLAGEDIAIREHGVPDERSLFDELPEEPLCDSA